MSKRFTPSATALLAAVATLAPAVATAQQYGYGYAPGYAQSYHGDDDRGYYDRSGYRDRGGYDRYGNYDRRDHRCDRGTGGAIIGAIAGGLLGNTVARRGYRTLGTVLGAGAGALAGNAIGRSGNPGYCRR